MSYGIFAHTDDRYIFVMMKCLTVPLH